MRTRPEKLPGLHLEHEPGAIDFDGVASDAQVDGHRLVGSAQQHAVLHPFDRGVTPGIFVTGVPSNLPTSTNSSIKSKVPALRAATAIDTSPWSVTTMTGGPIASLFNHFSNAGQIGRGRHTPATMQPAMSSAGAARKAVADFCRRQTLARRA
jgi:hypothetical protein